MGFMEILDVIMLTGWAIMYMLDFKFDFFFDRK